MAENETKELTEKKKKHEKKFYVYPDGTVLVYYEQNLKKTTDVVIGYRIPRVNVQAKNDLIGIYDCVNSPNKLVFYQGADNNVRIPIIKPGLPHFIEHMIYSSLESISKEQIYDYFAKTDTRYNAFTTQDTLAAEFSCPSKFNKQVFALYSAMIYREKYNEQDLENEKGPVYQELEGVLDEHGIQSEDDLLYQLLFGNYDNLTAEEILGCDKKIIDSFDEKQMLKFIKSYFTKQNMIISVVSDRPFKEIKELCDKWFVDKAPSIEATRVVTPQPVYSFNNDELLLIADKNAKTANISFILKGIPDYEKNEIYSTVESFILNNFNGRLMKKLRNHNGKVYTPKFVDGNMPGLAIKILEAQTTPEHVAAVLEAMTEILTDLAQKGITDEEFEGFKEMWENRRDRAASVKHNSASILYDKILHGLKPFVGEYNKKISDLTKEDINNYLKDTYAHAKCCLAITGNFDEKSIKPFEQILKFRPLDKYMDEKFIDKEAEDDFIKFLLEASDAEYNKRIHYVENEEYKKRIEASKKADKQKKQQEAEKKKQETEKKKKQEAEKEKEKEKEKDKKSEGKKEQPKEEPKKADDEEDGLKK